MPFIKVSQNTENARAGGEFKGLILASTVWYEMLSVGFHFCDMYFLQFLKLITQNLFIIPDEKNPCI